jgi:hypothetical protein
MSMGAERSEERPAWRRGWLQGRESEAWEAAWAPARQARQWKCSLGEYKRRQSADYSAMKKFDRGQIPISQER